MAGTVREKTGSEHAQGLYRQSGLFRRAAALDTKTLDAAGGDEQLPPLAPDGIEVEENASPRDELPTMEELEVARDNLSKKIAAEGADKKD